MLSYPGPDKNHVNLCTVCIECHISTSSIDAGFTADDVKNDVSLYKVDVNAKSRTAVAGSVGFFKLEEKLFKGKSLLYSKFYFENQML